MSPQPAVGRRRRRRHCQLIKSRTTAVRLSGHGNWLQAFSPLAAAVLWESLWKITEPLLFFSKVMSGGNPHVSLNGVSGTVGSTLSELAVHRLLFIAKGPLLEQSGTGWTLQERVL